MKNSWFRMWAIGLLVLSMLTVPSLSCPVYCEGTVAPEDVKVFVNFDKDYVDVENHFTVWGHYNGLVQTEIQAISAVYSREGRLMQMQVSLGIPLVPGKDFSYQDLLVLNSGVQATDAVLKVYAWSSMLDMIPLCQTFQSSNVQFTYTLAGPAKTSAGVYDEQGRLLRTLWSAKQEDAGTYTKTWDGRDDNGVLQMDGNYTVKVLENNVEIKTDAFIGNTSDHTQHDNIIAGYSQFLSDMAYTNGQVFYIFPYSEGKEPIYYFNAAEPAKKAGEFGGSGKIMQRAATDDEKIYFMNTETASGITRTFLYAFDLKSRSQHMFDQGEWLPSWGVDFGAPPDVYYAVNIIEHARDIFQTGGLAVQKNGQFLFASYVAQGKVCVIDKVSGAVVKSYDFLDPRALAYDHNGGVWIGYQKADGRYTAERYSVGQDGMLTLDNSVSLEDDFGYLLHLEVSPDGRGLVAADGERNQYLMYDTQTGKRLWSFGSGESYGDDPEVKPDKLMLTYTYNKTDLVFSEFENAHTLWVGDTGNNRAYKLSLVNDSPTIVDEIMLQPGSHSLGLDMTEPSRVLTGGMEFKLDYTKSGQDCWKLIKNWKQQTREYGLDIGTWNQFINLITMPNGKTYFSAYYENKPQLFCLEDKTIRYTGIDFENMIMFENGNAGSIVSDNGATVYKIHEMTGYNENNDPVYDRAGKIVARLLPEQTDPTHIFGSMKLNMPITDSNIMVTLRSSQNTSIDTKKTMHLGGVQLGEEVAEEWAWKAAPEGSEYYDGNFPEDGTFEAGNGVLNSAQKVVTSGNNIVFQYNGEFYKQGQSNKLYFYRDNGLLVGVFGDACRQRLSAEKKNDYGKEIFPGNAFDMYFVQDKNDSDKAYIIQNNENGFGNFKYNVTGIDSIKEHAVEIYFESALWDGLTYSYYKTSDNDAASLVQREWRPNIKAEPYIKGDDFTMQYTGFIRKPAGVTGDLKLYISTREKAEVIIGDRTVFDQAGQATPSISLEEGKLYPFSFKVKNTPEKTTGGETRVIFLYYAGRKLEAFTDKDFQTMPIEYQNKSQYKVDLLENLPFASSIKNGEYGITRSTEGNIVGLSVNTNSMNASFDAVRDLRFQANLWPTEGGMYPRFGWFAKNLGQPKENMTSWTLDTDIARIGYLNYGDLGNPENSTGIHIDILDVNGKVIARFFWAKENKAYGNGNMEANVICQATDMPHNNLNADLYTIPGHYDNQFNTPSRLCITGENGKITFEYLGGRISVPVFEEGAQWDKPMTLKADAFYNYDTTGNAREMNISFTRLDYIQNCSEG